MRQHGPASRTRQCWEGTPGTAAKQGLLPLHPILRKRTIQQGCIKKITRGGVQKEPDEGVPGSAADGCGAWAPLPAVWWDAATGTSLSHDGTSAALSGFRVQGAHMLDAPGKVPHVSGHRNHGTRAHRSCTQHPGRRVGDLRHWSLVKASLHARSPPRPERADVRLPAMGSCSPVGPGTGRGLGLAGAQRRTAVPPAFPPWHPSARAQLSPLAQHQLQRRSPLYHLPLAQQDIKWFDRNHWRR